MDIASVLTLQNLDWRCYRLPLLQEFTTSLEAARFRYGAIIEATLSEGKTGVGEVAPLPLQHPSALARALAPAPALLANLAGQSLAETLERLDRFAASNVFPAALLCGVEIALLDALGKNLHCGLATLLEEGQRVIPRAAVSVNTVIGVVDVAASVRSASQAVAAGFTCLKLKVGAQHQLEREVELVAAVREAIGPDIGLRLDANGAWNLAEARAIITACSPYCIEYVEQPLPPAALHEMRILRQQAPIPIAADEAVIDLSSAHRILDAEAADILVIKPQIVGGLRVSRQIVHEAATRGIESVLTSTIEAGIGVAATLHLAAALPEITRACGLGTLPLLADDLIVEAMPVSAGAMSVPQACGLGVTLDESALNRYKYDL